MTSVGVQETNTERTLLSTVGNAFSLMTSGISNPAQWLMEAIGFRTSSSGVMVTVENALGIPEVYNAVAKISAHISSLPLQAIDPETKQPVTSQGVERWNSPSMLNTRPELVEKLMVDTLLLGNGRLWIERDVTGQPIALWPIQSKNTQTVMVDGERYHFVTMNDGDDFTALKNAAGVDGSATVAQYKIPDRDVFYIMGLTKNGFWGESTIQLMRDTLGLSIVGCESAGTLYKNSGKPGIILEAPLGAFADQEEAAEFLNDFRNAHDGVDSAGKTAMIKDGMKATSINYQQMDTSHVAMRQFQREASALIFLLESVIGSESNAYKSVTEKNSAYLTNCIQRWTNKIEAEADRKLLSRRAYARGVRSHMDRTPLFQNDRYNLALYTSSLRQQGIASTNDCRSIHGLPAAEVADGVDYDTDYHSLAAGGGNSSNPNEEQQADMNESESPDDAGNQDD